MCHDSIDHLFELLDAACLCLLDPIVHNLFRQLLHLHITSDGIQIVLGVEVYPTLIITGKEFVAHIVRMAVVVHRHAYQRVVGFIPIGLVLRPGVEQGIEGTGRLCFISSGESAFSIVQAESGRSFINASEWCRVSVTDFGSLQDRRASNRGRIHRIAQSCIHSCHRVSILF